MEVKKEEKEPIDAFTHVAYWFVRVGVSFVFLAVFGVVARVIFEAFMLGWRVFG